MIAHEDVGRDVHAGDVAEVWGPVYVGPCDRDKYLSGQVAPLLGQLGGTGGTSEVVNCVTHSPIIASRAGGPGVRHSFRVRR